MTTALDTCQTAEEKVDALADEVAALQALMAGYLDSTRALMCQFRNAHNEAVADIEELFSSHQELATITQHQAGAIDRGMVYLEKLSSALSKGYPNPPPPPPPQSSRILASGSRTGPPTPANPSSPTTIHPSTPAASASSTTPPKKALIPHSSTTPPVLTPKPLLSTKAKGKEPAIAPCEEDEVLVAEKARSLGATVDSVRKAMSGAHDLYAEAANLLRANDTELGAILSEMDAEHSARVDQVAHVVGSAHRMAETAHDYFDWQQRSGFTLAKAASASPAVQKAALDDLAHAPFIKNYKITWSVKWHKDPDAVTREEAVAMLKNVPLSFQLVPVYGGAESQTDGVGATASAASTSTLRGETRGPPSTKSMIPDNGRTASEAALLTPRTVDTKGKACADEDSARRPLEIATSHPRCASTSSAGPAPGAREASPSVHASAARTKRGADVAGGSRSQAVSAREKKRRAEEEPEDGEEGSVPPRPTARVPRQGKRLRA
ncbi:uncharacterized protein BXZ73DRAFT_100809 [Epithele typhae]|uniref:uncharacterized protein n=1 Tax=Epithele typhae TaxID=378194 RepID=UPI002007F1E4|nr:uncharacterized protein BXZ73DRAFT_100809 [Epithele typhae]KAH9933972.1 hypothetical protein BXZ73DRAFT_100809 [Epithele typhae]